MASFTNDSDIQIINKKNKLCSFFWGSKICEKNNECVFIHNDPPCNFKIVMCKYRKKCKLSHFNCSFAHSKVELNYFQNRDFSNDILREEILRFYRKISNNYEINNDEINNKNIILERILQYSTTMNATQIQDYLEYEQLKHIIQIDVNNYLNKSS
jgi:hypothetical protein